MARPPARGQAELETLTKAELAGPGLVYDDDDAAGDLPPWTCADSAPGCGPAGGTGIIGGGGRRKPVCLRLPELVDTLAKEGQVLRWDDGLRLYEVRRGLAPAPRPVAGPRSGCPRAFLPGCRPPLLAFPPAFP